MATKPSWVTTDPNSGSLNGSVQVTAKENTATEPRSGVVSFGGGAIVKEVNVSQKEASPSYTMSAIRGNFIQDRTSPTQAQILSFTNGTINTVSDGTVPCISINEILELKAGKIFVMTIQITSSIPAGSALQLGHSVRGSVTGIEGNSIEFFQETQTPVLTNVAIGFDGKTESFNSENGSITLMAFPIVKQDEGLIGVLQCRMRVVF